MRFFSLPAGLRLVPAAFAFTLIALPSLLHGQATTATPGTGSATTPAAAAPTPAAQAQPAGSQTHVAHEQDTPLIEKLKHTRPIDAEATLPTHYDLLRGAYGPFRANNDLLYYHLDIRVDPEKQFVSGKNTIRFKMLKDGTRIQLDLFDSLKIDKILLGETELKYVRDDGAVFIDFPETLHAGKTYTIEFYYSGHPEETGRFGGMTFKKDPAGRVWINTACEETGASMWWPD